MAIYSVYNYDTQRYDYYEGSGPKGTHADSPIVRAKSELGAAPELAAWKLPLGARRIGSGDLPRGRIASPSGGSAASGLGGIADDPVKIGVVAGLAYLAWKVLR